MKKKNIILLSLILIIIVVVIIIVAIQNKETNSKENRNETRVEGTVEKDTINSDKVDNKKDNNDNVDDEGFNSGIEESNEKQYTHTALSGCIIIDTDGTAVTYKNKCENCDYISNTRNNIYHSSGTYTSSFTCPDCKKVNSIKIQTTSK